MPTVSTFNHLPLGEPVNDSEILAIELVNNELRKSAGYLLSNAQISTSPAFSPSEIDLLLILPTGVQVIEVKHWSRAYIKENQHVVDKQSDILTDKVKRIASFFKRQCEVGFLSGKILLTDEHKPIDKQYRSNRGVQFYSLKEIKDLVIPESRLALSPVQMEMLVKAVAPAGVQIINGGFRRIRDFVNLELQPGCERFHRIYRGLHGPSSTRIVLHLYDLSAKPDQKGKENAESLARREYESLLALQASNAAVYLPIPRDSFQELPEYPGEIKMFTVFDLLAPTLEKRMADNKWSASERINFTKEALLALDIFHNPKGPQKLRLVHRNLSPATIHVTADGEPRFSGLDFAKIMDHATISLQKDAPANQFAAPEIKAVGLAAADQRSDVFSLCASLLKMLEGQNENGIEDVQNILKDGICDNPEERLTAKLLYEELLKIIPAPAKEFKKTDLPLPKYWSEGTEVDFRNRRYRILARLGSGGIGQTFKVCAMKDDGEESETYVAKTIEDKDKAMFSLRAYKQVRHLTGRNNLAVIFEVEDEENWSPYGFVALLNWVEGESLANISGCIAESAISQNAENIDDFVAGLALQACEALDELHRHGFVHGDISPENLIYREGLVTLTDYDLLTPVGKNPQGIGKIHYCTPEMMQGVSAPSAPSADVYALAVSFAKAILGRQPFPESVSGGIDKSKAISFSDDVKKAFPKMSNYIFKATSPALSKRFKDARSAIEMIKNYPVLSKHISDSPKLSRNHIPWLKNILSAYPGSMHGNAETRGLDSEFAVQTYVGTEFEDSLIQEIKERRIRLLILTGNAGDGKTAMLQHISRRLGMEEKCSSERVWQHVIDSPEGSLKIVVNLDGSASYKDLSADKLLDEFMGPFMDGTFPPDATHLLAINDGRLAEWLDHYRERKEIPLNLAGILSECLLGEPTNLPVHIRFVNLNYRSLVGKAQDENKESNFALCLLDKFLNGNDESDLWEPCKTCLSQSRCVAWNSVKTLRSSVGQRVRDSLLQSMKTVHMRGETHITARELRAAISYIFFNVYDCEELHNDPNLVPIPYWNMTFCSDTPHRQGELLHELTLLDPGVDSHPAIDRYLVGQSAYDTEGMPPRYLDMAVGSARRRAFFEWTPEQIKSIAGSENSLTLLDGQFYNLFLSTENLTSEDSQDLCMNLCKGLAKLDDLPRQAFRKNEIPLRLIPRSPTETVFWIVKPASNFHIEVKKPPMKTGLPFLHSQLRLIYITSNNSKEVLEMGYDLFRTLLELNDGLQLVGQDSDDLFANLETFTRRLAQEDSRTWKAWTPSADSTIYELSINFNDGTKRLDCTPISFAEDGQ